MKRLRGGQVIDFIQVRVEEAMKSETTDAKLVLIPVVISVLVIAGQVIRLLVEK